MRPAVPYLQTSAFQLQKKKKKKESTIILDW